MYYVIQENLLREYGHKALVEHLDKIVELGCINHCGFYDANMGKLIDRLERMIF